MPNLFSQNLLPTLSYTPNKKGPCIPTKVEIQGPSPTNRSLDYAHLGYPIFYKNTY